MPRSISQVSFTRDVDRRNLIRILSLMKRNANKVPYANHYAPGMHREVEDIFAAEIARHAAELAAMSPEERAAHDAEEARIRREFGYT